MLHYILLVAFFVMMAEGVDVTISVLYVFKRKKQTKLLVILAWGGYSLLRADSLDIFHRVVNTVIDC